MLAKLPIDTASALLGDRTNRRWARADLYTYLTAGLGALSLVKPEAFGQLRTIQLVAGAVQAVPDDVAMWMGAIRNMGADGATPGDTIRNPENQVLDHFQGDWMSTPGTVVEDCYFSRDTPELFYVYPAIAADATVHIQARVSVEPSPVVDDATELGVKASYHMPLVHWILSMAYAANSDLGDKSLALAHEERFFSLLGIKSQIRATKPPRSQEDQT